MKTHSLMRSTVSRAAAMLALLALTACPNPAPEIDANWRMYPRENYSGWYDPYFGLGGKQLTDVRWVTRWHPGRVSDAVRFLHRRQDGTYVAIGRSEECDTDWDGNGTLDGCRDVVSLALYNHDGVRLDTVGMIIRHWLGNYTDYVPLASLSGMTYFVDAGILANPDPTPENPTIPWSALPNSVLAEDSYLSPSGAALVLTEEDVRNANCKDYEQPHQPLSPEVPLPCWHWRTGAVLAFDQNLNLDRNVLEASRRALATFANADGFGENCEKTYFSALAANAERIFIGGHREERPRVDQTRPFPCLETGPPKITPFVIALRMDGTRDTGFGTGGSWAPPWPQNDTQGGVVSDLQITATGNLVVLAGRWTHPSFTTVAMSVSPAGQLRAGFGANGELEFADVQFDPHARNMKLVLAANETAFVFSRHGRQIARIQNVVLGLRDTAFGPAGNGLYAAEPDVASLPAFAAIGPPRLMLHDIVPVCSGGVALIGTALQSQSKPMAIVLNRSGRRANNVHDTGTTLNPGVVFDNYAGMMPHARWGFGYAAMFDAGENKLLIGGSVGSEQDRAPAGSMPLFDFAISARQIRCVDVD